MKVRWFHGLFLILFWIFQGKVVLCQEISIDNFSGVGARAMGMGGAYSGVAEDFSAIYWNPAGLAQIRRIETYGAMSHQSIKDNSLFFGSPSTSQLSKTKLSSIGLVFPFPAYRGSLVFALGYNRLKTFDLSLKIDGYSTLTEFEKIGEASDNGGLGVFSIGGAIDVSPSVSVGGALNFWSGQDIFFQELTQTDTRHAHGDTTSLYEHFTFTDDYGGFNLTLGTMIKGPARTRFGIVLSTPVKYNIDEEWERDSEIVISGRTFTEPSGIYKDKYSIRMPYEFGLGVSWSPMNFTFAASAHYADWRESEYVSEPPSSEQNKQDFVNKYKEVWRFHIGGETMVPFINAQIRAGFYRDPLPYKGPRNPGEPLIKIGKDRNYISLGVGKLIDRVLSVDIALVRGIYEQTEGSLKEKVELTRIFGGIAYRF